MYMKKILQQFIFIPLMFSSSLWALSDQYFYIAANAGIFQGDFNNAYHDQTDIIKQNIEEPAIQHGYTGGIAFGYRKFIHAVYFLGGELVANIEGHSATFKSGASTTAFSDTVEIQNHIDLLFTPGMMLGQSCLTYLKLGLSYVSTEDTLTSPVGFNPIIMEFNTDKNTFGFAAGLGFEKFVTDHIAIMTEANYHDYGTVNFENFQNFSATYSHATHVYSYDVVVGVVYKL